MTEEEAHNSADSFPIEFRDMQEHRKVLHGMDVIAHLHVDTKHYRTQVEHELRAKLFRLRQQGAQVLSDPAALLKLCVDSVATFCTLGRHALAAAGVEVAGGRRDAVRGCRKAGEAVGSAVESVRRAAGSPRRTKSARLTSWKRATRWIVCAISGIHSRMVEYVDRMEDHK